VRAISDTAFWIISLLLAHAILGIQTTKTIAPILTILFGLSFALGPPIGNLCLSMAYVLFMLPYEVGNRILIISSCGDRRKDLIGQVASITLPYTSLVTRSNETVKVPNHTLFHQQVINMNESTCATFEVKIDLPLERSKPPEGKITLGVMNDVYSDFWAIVEQRVKDGAAGEWTNLEIFLNEINIHSNSIRYSMWLTHMGAWHEVETIPFPNDHNYCPIR
jgi:hypothetical protein